MKKLSRWFCLLCVFFFLASCASTPVPPPQYTYGKDAIRIHLKADPQLNSYQGSSHTLLICVYQLSDPNAFNQLAGDTDGLYKLLDCQRFDPSVTNSKRLFVNPGQDSAFMLDRAEGTKYVGLVAGYYVMERDNMVRLFKIPVVVETKGVFSRTKISKPGDLDVEIVLGPQQIQEAKPRKQDKD